MPQFESEEPTRPDIKHPSKPESKPELTVSDAVNGDVGSVEVYLKGEPLAPLQEPKRPQGRPSKFTPEIKAELLRLIEDGTPIRTSCKLVGIGQSTYQTWKAWAAKDLESEFAAFFIDIDRARAVAERNLIELARQGDSKSWSEGPSKSAKWLLERMFGNDYAPRIGMKLEKLGDLTLDAIERICSAKDCGCYSELLTAISAIETSESETS